jgi:hypothetical protein
MDGGEVNKGYAVNYFRAVLDQEKVRLMQINTRHGAYGSFYNLALEDLERRLVAKLAHGPAFFNLGLDQVQKDGGSYGRYRDGKKDGSGNL